MKYNDMKFALKRLNEKWKLDFVSATSGNCCNTCGEMRTPKATEEWEKAETYLVVKWFFKGMNYNGKFEDQKHLYIKYSLGDVVDIDTVCKDLSYYLTDCLKAYKVIKPKDEHYCIELIKIEEK